MTNEQIAAMKAAAEKATSFEWVEVADVLKDSPLLTKQEATYIAQAKGKVKKWQ